MKATRTPDPRSPKSRPRQPSNQVFLPEGLDPGDRRIMFVLPPGATTSMNVEDQEISTYLPLWRPWLQIAERGAEDAEMAREDDDLIDHASAALAKLTAEPLPEREPPVPSEMQAAMIAVVSSAAAVDGFYGAVKPVVSPPKSTAKRPRQIVETLKLGFRLGRSAKIWTNDLDWLFECRDFAVHHGPEFGGLYAARATARTLVVGPPEVYFLSAPVGRRALEVARGLIDECLRNPKDVTRDWVESLEGETTLNPALVPKTAPSA